MRSCKHTNTIIYRGKQHCNVSKANIGLRRRRQSENVYYKVCAKGNFYGYA